MRVQGSNGKWYTRDHPHEIISPHIMRFEEIRWWLKELSTNPEYGWTEKGGVGGLERALGMGVGIIRHKLRVAWIWPKEQVRLTSRIRDVIEGRVVPRKIGRKWEGVCVDPPQPPQVSDKPKSVKIAVQIGSLKMLPQDHRPPMRLPDFKDACRTAPTWNAK